jgi:hypothetical protein
VRKLGGERSEQLIRSAARKAVRVGRATVFLVGLAVILALLFGAASTAFARNGDPLKLGSLKNTATKMTVLVGKVADTTRAALQVKNTGGGSALDLQVNAGAPNLDADRLDGRDASSFAASTHTHSGTDITGGTVAEARIDPSLARDGEVMPTVRANDGPGSGLDADKLDGLDSTALGITTNHNRQQISTCDTPPPDPKSGPSPRQACAPLQVVVPPGKRYLVSVWSSFSVYGFYADPPQEVRYCSAMKGPGQAEPSCISPFGQTNKATILQDAFISASSSGETLPLAEGAYTFGTVIMPQSRELTGVHNPDDFVITKVMVRDASAPQPSGVSIP